MSNIVVVGSLNMDLIISTPRMPQLGETLYGNGFRTVSGGKGSNQAYAAARMGADVYMVGRVGEDAFGASLTQSLESVGAHTEYVFRTEDAPTGVAIITICEGNNSIILDAGSNAKLTIQDMQRVESLLDKADAVMLQLEIPMEVIQHIVRYCKGKTRIFLNPAPAQALDDALLKGVDFLTPNEIEASQLSGIEVVDQKSAFAALDFFRSKGVFYPLITLGEKGVAYYDGKENRLSSPRCVKAIDSTAAGDTFSGAFVHMLCDGANMEEAIDFAQAAAAVAVTRKGAQSSIPSYDEVCAYMNA